MGSALVKGFSAAGLPNCDFAAHVIDLKRRTARRRPGKAASHLSVCLAMLCNDGESESGEMMIKSGECARRGIKSFFFSLLHIFVCFATQQKLIRLRREESRNREDSETSQPASSLTRYHPVTVA